MNLVYNWDNDAAAGILVRSDRMQGQEQDIADALSTCITKDGQTTVTANIPMAGFKFTGLGNGASGQDSVTWTQVFVSPSFASPTFTGTVTGSGATAFTVPTETAGDSSTKAASTAFVQGVAMTAALPNQAGNAGKIVTTDGSSASWTSPVSIPELWMGF